MSRGVVAFLLLSLSLPARADGPPPMTLADRAFWVGVGGAGTTLIGTGLWLQSLRQIGEAEAAGDASSATRGRHLGVIGGSLAFTGLFALATAAVMSSWHEAPVELGLSVTPAGAWTFWVGGRSF